MNRFIRYLLYPARSIIGIGYGRCNCCGFPWNMTKPHTINITDVIGSFATCEDCWNRKSNADLVIAYNKLYDDWLHGDKFNKPLTVEQIGFTRTQMIESLQKALAEKDKETINTVFIEDKYYDYVTDNDDMEDIPTIVKVTYSDGGRIIKVEIANRNQSSPQSELNKFYELCGINPYGGLPQYKYYSLLRHDNRRIG